MKIYYDIIQGTPEWHKVRCGVFTASMFSKLITPKTDKISEQADMLENRIVAEILTGNPIDDFGGTKWTDRGKELEPDAVKMYEMITGKEVIHAGFISNDDGTAGCSPDGFIVDDRGLELKCPMPDTHVDNVLRGTAEKDHKPQIQGSLYVTGFKQWDIMSYHPEMKPSIITVERDDEYIKLLEEILKESLDSVQRKLEIMRN